MNSSANSLVPDNFNFKTLDLRHLDVITSLLEKHYIENEFHSLSYSKDFLYWYLSYIPPGLIIGLIYRNTLVGIISAILLDMIVCEQKIKMPYINLLCVQTKIRKLGFAKLLIDEMNIRLEKNGLPYAMASSPKFIKNSFHATESFLVPINYQKLQNIGFNLDDLFPLPKFDINPLHLMVEEDIAEITIKLNNYLKKYAIKMYFTNDSTRHFLFPKKNIVYSFVKKQNNVVTDFVSVYKVDYRCSSTNQMITTAVLAFYYHESMDLTRLIMYLLDKLPSYGIDQFKFTDVSDINVTKFESCDKLHFTFHNVQLPQLESNKLFFCPFW